MVMAVKNPIKPFGISDLEWQKLEPEGIMKDEGVGLRRQLVLNTYKLPDIRPV